MRVVARKQARRGVDHTAIEIAPFAWEAVTHAIDEGGEMRRKDLQSLGVGSVIDPGADGNAQARIVPPRGIEAGQRPQDGLALRHGRRQRPRRGRCMRFAQILENEVPGLGCLIPRGVEAARHKTRRRKRRDLAIEGYFLAAGGMDVARRPGQPCLEDHGARRRAVGDLVGQAQPQDAGHDGRVGVLHIDIADAAAAQRAGAAKRIGEMLGVCRARQGSAVTAARYHAALDGAKPARPSHLELKFITL